MFGLCGYHLAPGPRLNGIRFCAAVLDNSNEIFNVDRPDGG